MADEPLIKVTFSGIDAQQKQIDKITRAVNNPNIHKMVQGIAGVWQSNFDSEGGSVGGWRELTEQTQKLRTSRGFPPEHPILVQTGSLKRAAVTGLLNVNGPRVLTFKDVMMSYQPAQFGATLQISGAKVDNQFRIRGDGFSAPARPFWYVDPSVEEAAVAALSNWLNNEIGL